MDNARRADWVVVPTRRRFLPVALHRLLLCLSQFGAACLENSFPITRDEPLDLLDEQRKRRLGICSDAQIGFLVASEMPIITPRKKIKGADADQFRVRFQRQSRKQRMLEGQDDVRIAKDSIVLTQVVA